MFQVFFGSVLPKAAFTSSAFMRSGGSPGSFRLCSSVPSPIIPGLIILADLLGALTIGLFVTLISLLKCDDAAALSNDHDSSERAFQVRVRNYSIRHCVGDGLPRALRTRPAPRQSYCLCAVQQSSPADILESSIRGCNYVTSCGLVIPDVRLSVP